MLLRQPMLRGRLSSSFLAAAAVAGAACLIPDLARAGRGAFERDPDRAVLVDGDRNFEAKVFSCNTGRPRILIDIPTEPKIFILEGRTAFAVRRENVEFLAAKDKDPEKATLVKEQFAFTVPVAREERTLRFQADVAEVRVVEVDRGQPGPPGQELPLVAAPPTPETTPSTVASAPAVASAPERLSGTPVTTVAQGGDATACMSIDTRPAVGVPGCSRFVYLRNTCETAVIAQVQRVEHLMTGTLPQAFAVTVPPGEVWLGCAWWSGGAAPSEHRVLAAVYLEPPPAPPSTSKRASARH
jgi:hypothetical protein